MNKLILSGCVTVLAMAQALAKTTVVGDCLFCGGGAIIEDDPSPVPHETEPGECIFCGGGSGGGSSAVTYWAQSTKRSVIFTDDAGVYAGTVEIKTSKINKKKNTVEVSATFKMQSGKKYSASGKAVTPDEDWTLVASWPKVGDLGAVEISIAKNGEVTGYAGDYELSQEGVGDDDDDDDEVFEHGEHTFTVETDDYELNEKYELLTEILPEGVEIVTSSAKKWNCGKTPSIKYKKFKEDGETWYELVGLDDEVKTNYSGLKLTFDKKKNTVKGSFKAYATNEYSIEKGKPKLKSYSFTLKGSISGSTITGTATCKKLKANWTFVID